MTVYLVNISIYEGGSYFVAAYDTKAKADKRKAKLTRKFDRDGNILDKSYVKSVRVG